MLNASCESDGLTVLCLWARYLILCLVLVTPRHDWNIIKPSRKWYAKPHFQWKPGKISEIWCLLQSGVTRLMHDPLTHDIAIFVESHPFSTTKWSQNACMNAFAYWSHAPFVNMNIDNGFDGIIIYLVSWLFDRVYTIHDIHQNIWECVVSPKKAQ